MSNEEFANLYNGFFGAELDRPEQLKKIVFTGEDLKEFMEYLKERFTAIYNTQTLNLKS